MRNLQKTWLCFTVLVFILAGCAQTAPTPTPTLQNLAQISAGAENAARTPDNPKDTPTAEHTDEYTRCPSVENISLYFQSEAEFVAAVKEAKRSGKEDVADLKGIDFYLRPDNLPQEGYPLYQIWVTPGMIRFTYYRPEDLIEPDDIFFARNMGNYYYLDLTREYWSDPLAPYRQSFEDGFANAQKDGKYLLWMAGEWMTGGEIYWAQENALVRVQFADAPNAEGGYDDIDKLISYCAATRVDITLD